jgi:hypothetical protein
MRKLSWLACTDPKTGAERLCTWSGPSRLVVVLGLDVEPDSAPMTIELPDDARVIEVPIDTDGRSLAVELGGLLFTVFAKDLPRLRAEKPPANA